MDAAKDAAKAVTNDAAIDAAIDDAWCRFESILPELVAELPLLRTDGIRPERLRSPIARTMAQAVWPYHDEFGLFVTPMAAVAGSVAQAVLTCLVRNGVRRAFVNNGGDIAVHLAPGSRFNIGVVSNAYARNAQGLAPLAAGIELRAADCIGGVATSGWRGRSLSLGIADSVTVLADTAAQADAAATLIANQVDIDHPAIVRRPAHLVRDGSDLLDRLVTCAVPVLSRPVVDEALGRGAEFAERLRDRGLVVAALLSLQGQQCAIGPDHLLARRAATTFRIPGETRTWQPTSENCR